jgi:hypothetical protein
MTSGWYQELLNYEYAYCLTPHGANSTTSYASFSLVLTNLTTTSSHGCTANSRNGGLVIQIVSNGGLVQASFAAVNNTTTASNQSAGEYDTTTTLVGLYGDIEFIQSVYWVNPTNESHEKLELTDCGSSCGGGGTTTTSSGGVSTSSLTTCTTGSGSPTIYWWDSVCFDKGYPTRYPHPDRTAYSILATNNWAANGNQLTHAQVGSNTVTLYNTITDGIAALLIGGLIGALVGGVAGGGVGAMVGSAAGLLIGALLYYFTSVTFIDESSTIWGWVNKGFITSMETAPVYLIPYIGFYAWFLAYVVPALTYLRVGNQSAVNNISLSGP